MKKINLSQEKTSAKLLYLFDSDFYYKKRLYLESESSGKVSFLSTIKKIFSFIGSILKRFAFIAFLAFLIITSLFTADIFAFILSTIMGIIIGTGVSHLTNPVKDFKAQKTVNKINEILKENGYKEVDFLEVIGICYKDSKIINLNEALREALDLDEKNNFDNKKLKKIIKKLNNRKEIEEKIKLLLYEEDSDAVSYLESHGFKKISSEDYIIIDNANKKTLLSKFFDNLENKYSYKQYDPEKAEEINGLKSNLDLKKKFSNIFSKKSGFGLKTLMNYLNNKAKTVQKYLSELLMLIISIFNPKTYSECNKTVKKEIRKIKFFLEKYLIVNNKKSIFYEEKKTKEIYNENFSLPFSKTGNPGNAIKIIYRVNNHKITINSILSEINVVGPNVSEIWKKIFPNKNITGDSYKWQKGEWKIIKSYIENSNVSTNNSNNANSGTEDNTDSNTEDNTDNSAEDNTDNSAEDNTDNSAEDNTDSNTEDNADNSTEDNAEDNVKNDNENKIDSSSIKKKTSYLMLMKRGIESAPVKYLIIGIIIAIPFFSFGATTLANTKSNFSASALGKLITQITDWLGWGGTIIASATITGFGYLLIKRSVEKMNVKMLSDSMEKAEKNSNKLQSTISPALEKIQNIAEKNEKKTGIIDKAKNFFGLGKKSIDDNYQYKNKKELLYNENYIMKEYFKIEKKLKKPVF